MNYVKLAVAIIALLRELIEYLGSLKDSCAADKTKKVQSFKRLLNKAKSKSK